MLEAGLALSGCEHDVVSTDCSPASVVNYAKYIKENVVSRCPTDVEDVSHDGERC